MVAGKYNPEEVEKKWKEYWEKEGIFKFNPKLNKPIYSIDTPPPTVSGEMHIGHSCSYSQEDFIARYKRMKGFNVFYPFGTDDNGLPTKLLIEKTKKIKSNEMSRKEFVKLCLETLDKEIRPKFIDDWKKLGMSCDFSLFYTTINEHSQKISQKSFINLYKIGREYRKEAAAMYCPKCRTAISQVELEDKLMDSYFNDIIFKVNMGEKEEDLVIATTRPELLPACVAVFFHPNDERYEKYKGKKAKVPLFNFEVPILADERVSIDKGTGVVMCCTFGDAVDVEWQKAYNLPIKEAFGKNGRMTSIANEFEGMKIKQAREEIIKKMKEQKLLLNQIAIKHTVNVHERCGTPIEFIHSKQWFIKYLDLKEDMLKWGNELNWFPSHMKNRYDNWVNGLQWDWCISRQIPFGIPFPVWYCKKCGEVILAKEEDLPVDPTEDNPPINECPKCGSKEFEPEKDIINTWATSSLTPIISTSLIPEIQDKLFPMDLRPQAHDIISFWLFNTVVKSQLHYKKNPWRDVIISGWVLDPHGKKMSKSKGNVIKPQDMIKKYSSDCLRYWASGTKLGEDVSFQEKEFVTGKKLVTKMWNASKFVFMHLDDYDSRVKLNINELEFMDRWMLAKLNETIKTATKFFDEYEYSKAKLEIEKLFYQSFCDNYLEIIKDRVYNPDKRGEKQRKSAQFVLYNSLNSILKMFAPILVYITEELYDIYFKKYEKQKSIHLTSWPEIKKEFENKEIEKTGDIVIEIISEVRKFKSSNNLSLKEELNKLILEKEIFEKIQPAIEDLKSTIKVNKIVVGTGKISTLSGIKIDIEK